MAAARLLQSRLASLLGRNRPLFSIPQGRALSYHSTKVARGSHESDNRTDNNVEDSKAHQDDSKSLSNSFEVQSPGDKASNGSYDAFSNLKASTRHDMVMMFTCKVCETRSMKTLCRESYEKGVVIARCGGCNNLHLIADHLGWFGKPGTVEELLAARGEEVKRGSVDTLNLTLEDLVGTKSS